MANDPSSLPHTGTQPQVIPQPTTHPETLLQCALGVHSGALISDEESGEIEPQGSLAFALRPRDDQDGLLRAMPENSPTTPHRWELRG